MKLILETWRKYLTEAQQSPHQIYCDMDGVLVDFVAGAVKQINEDVHDKNLSSKDEKTGKLTYLGRLRMILRREGLDKIEDTHIEKNSEGPPKVRKAAIKYMYVRLADDERFWANLPWMEGGRDLWNAIKRYDPIILTAPMGKGSEEGKRQWISKNLSPSPQDIIMSHDKFNWAMTDGNRNVIVDDFMSNIKPWKEHGGIAIHHDHKDMSHTMNKLTQAGFKVLQSPNEHPEEDGSDEN